MSHSFEFSVFIAPLYVDELLIYEKIQLVFQSFLINLPPCASGVSISSKVNHKSLFICLIILSLCQHSYIFHCLVVTILLMICIYRLDNNNLTRACSVHTYVYMFLTNLHLCWGMEGVIYTVTRSAVNRSYFINLIFLFWKWFSSPLMLHSRSQVRILSSLSEEENRQSVNRQDILHFWER